MDSLIFLQRKKEIMRPMNVKRQLLVLLAFVVFFTFLGIFVLSQREQLLMKVGYWLVINPTIHKSDLIVALGGRVGRKEEAVRLFKLGFARQILFSGQRIEYSVYKRFGIPDESVFSASPPKAHNTYEEATVLRTLLKGHDVKSVLIVSSSYHLRRVSFTFKRVFDGSGVRLFFASVSNSNFNTKDWWKNAKDRRRVFHEYLGLIYYWLTV